MIVVASRAVAACAMAVPVALLSVTLTVPALACPACANTVAASSATYGLLGLMMLAPYAALLVIARAVRRARRHDAGRLR